MLPYNAKPGSAEWLQSFSASKAAAMLGLSSYMPRNKLLHIMHTGQADERSEWFQKNILDYGHEVEAHSRELVEEMLNDSLYVLGGQADFGLSRPLTATVDGITIDHHLAWENKQPNAALIESVNNGILPDEYCPQVQQIMMVTGCESVLFTVSDGAKIVANIEVLPDPAWRERILAGWAQFERDLASYTPPEVTEKPAAEAIMQLPAVVINATGGLTASNIHEMKPRWDHSITESKARLATIDIANGKAIGKFGRETAKLLRLKAKEVVDQIATVSEAVRTLEFYAAEFDAMGLAYEKATARLEKDGAEAALNKVRATYTDHVAALQAGVEPIRLVIPQPDFAFALRNLRTVESKNNALSTALANAIIAADAIAKDIRAKQAWFFSIDKDPSNVSWMFLFRDFPQVIYKPLDDFKLLVTTRIDHHKAAEATKLVAERQRIRDEEEAKARAKVQAEQAAKQKAEQEDAESVKPTPTPAQPKMSPAVAQDLARAKAAVAGRPSDEAIVTALALHFRVTEMKIIEWLLAMDISAVGERMAIEFQGEAP